MTMTDIALKYRKEFEHLLDNWDKLTHKQRMEMFDHMDALKIKFLQAQRHDSTK